MSVELFGSAINKVVELLKYRQVRRQKRFDTLVQPLFEAMTVVHDDYLNIFYDINLMLYKERSGVEIMRALEASRLKHEGLRRMIASRSRALSRAKLPEEKAFFSAAVAYFNVAPIPFQHRPPSTIRRLLRSLSTKDVSAPAKLDSYVTFSSASSAIQPSLAELIDAEQIHQLALKWMVADGPEAAGLRFETIKAVGQLLEHLRTQWVNVVQAHADLLALNFK